MIDKILKNNKFKIGIIGGKGVMGRWLYNFFRELDLNVEVSDLDTEMSNQDIAENCDVVVLSTPIDDAVQISKDIGQILKSDQILFDICSQKETILDAMLKYTNAEVIGTHPMFGPTITTVKNQNIVLCRGRGEAGYKWLKNTFTSAGAKVTTIDAPTHDKQMAIVQSLTHFLTICFANTLKKMDIHPTDLFQTSTPVFKINSDLTGRLFAQDPELYATLIGSNKYALECLELFSESFDETKNSLMAGTHTEATEFIRQISSFIGSYKKEAMDRSNEFLDIIFQ